MRVCNGPQGRGMLHRGRRKAVAVHETLLQAVMQKDKHSFMSYKSDPSCWWHVTVIVVGTDLNPPMLLLVWGCL